MADDDIREGVPKKKKKILPPKDDDERPKKKLPVDEDDEPEDRPRKKRTADDEDEEETPPKKKKKPAAEEPEEESDMGESPLAAFIPVGGSVFALISLWTAIFSFVPAVVSLLLVTNTLQMMFVEKFPPIMGCILPILWPVAVLTGGLSFFTTKAKASYGSIAGNMRAIIGILLGLIAMVLHGVLIYLFFKG